MKGMFLKAVLSRQSCPVFSHHLSFESRQHTSWQGTAWSGLAQHGPAEGHLELVIHPHVQKHLVSAEIGLKLMSSAGKSVQQNLLSSILVFLSAHNLLCKASFMIITATSCCLSFYIEAIITPWKHAVLFLFHWYVLGADIEISFFHEFSFHQLN